MKYSALQLARAIVNDNKQYISDNISEHLINEVDANENNFYEYLTDDEIEAVTRSERKYIELREQVYSMLRENFDYDITEFEY